MISDFLRPGFKLARLTGAGPDGQLTHGPAKAIDGRLEPKHRLLVQANGEQVSTVARLFVAPRPCTVGDLIVHGSRTYRVAAVDEVPGLVEVDHLVLWLEGG